ncbi:hypothetical protein SAMN04487905_11165 [Actinopolyspora xinjiangensis]|uniref:Uncharacterized protein n=1 Tax=Actinopolyspora xinjiangensis TaxID=405564 RepID=A0A1H0W8T3_9ACTN|nr:hypothetical protein [Actinopolyspora xinjiangensis]SDP87154.1 hypothetical protein SAMN04487905_11165 [Actinopolyspora xinjiangensis]
MHDSRSEETDSGARSRRLHQPWRLAVAGAEVLVAALLIALAFPAWENSVVRIELPEAAGGAVVSRMLGSWVTLSVLAVTLGGLLLIDASRQLVLGVRAGRSGGRSRGDSGATTSEATSGSQ